MYGLKYTDTGKTHKEIIRGVIGAGQELLFTVIDDSGAAVDLSDLSAYLEIFIGIEGGLIVDGGTLTAVAAASGTFKYAIGSTDFNVEATDVGSWQVELKFANHATPASGTIIAIAGGASLKVTDTVSD